MTVAETSNAPFPRRAIDRLGVVIFALAMWGVLSPFILFRANRIVAGETLSLLDAMPGLSGYLFLAVLVSGAVMALFRLDARIRLGVSFALLLILAAGLGWAVSGVSPDGDKISRTSPALGFWLEMLAFGLLAVDSVVRLSLKPLSRLLLLAGVAVALTAILLSGLWSDLSVMREYANNADAFWREGGTHVALALGSLVAAFVVGLPLGIAGIGAAPAMVALFLYSLMPVVSNTLGGLDAVPEAANEAARGIAPRRCGFDARHDSVDLLARRRVLRQQVESDRLEHAQ